MTLPCERSQLIESSELLLCLLGANSDIIAEIRVEKAIAPA
jgi:hypothetical protein